jgi:hypothetical protein
MLSGPALGRAPHDVESMLVGPIPRNEVEQWSAASFFSDAAAHCCAGAAPCSLTHVAAGSQQSAAHPAFGGRSELRYPTKYNQMALVNKSAVVSACWTEGADVLHPYRAKGRTP